jgi:hypothetical protein
MVSSRLDPDEIDWAACDIIVVEDTNHDTVRIVIGAEPVF